MRILVIHQYFLAAGQPGGSRFNEMSRMWCEAGHQVDVIAGTVNYATGARQAGLANRWITRERDGDVVVQRCYVPQTYNSGFLGRCWALAGFMVSASWAVFLARPSDVVVASSPPLTVAVPGWVASLVRGVPLVFEVRDLWPESAVTTGVLAPSSVLTRILYALERWAYRRSALVNVLTPAFRDDILRRGLAPSPKIVCVPNGADSSLFSPGLRNNAMRDSLGWGDRLVALYAGAHGRANAVGQLVQAADVLRHRPDILIATVGDGPEQAQWAAEAAARGLKNIVFHGARPKELMPEILRAADVGLAVLQNNPTFRTVYPNKVFDYMACELPIVLGIDGAARQLICDDARSGVYAAPEDPAAIAEAIVALADDPSKRVRMGRSGRQWVVQNATREVLASKYLEYLDRTVKAWRNVRSTPDSAVN